jgi:hypothetical protein
MYNNMYRNITYVHVHVRVRVHVQYLMPNAHANVLHTAVPRNFAHGVPSNFAEVKTSSEKIPTSAEIEKPTSVDPPYAGCVRRGKVGLFSIV